MAKDRDRQDSSPRPGGGAGPSPANGDLLDRLNAAHADARMVGWDFSQLDGRLTADDPWWSFDGDCVDAMRAAREGILDLGTGGGERLSALVRTLRECPTRPVPIIATEGWAPNLPIARERLAPLGISVVPYDSEAREPLPIPDQSLDLVMARHESYDAAELARVLVPGGRFMTQQVDGFDAPEIHKWFGADFLHPDVTADHDVERLRGAGMRVDTVDQWEGTMRFADAVALVIYLGLVPWDVPGFTVDEHVQRLVALDASRPIVVTQRRFRVYATRL